MIRQILLDMDDTLFDFPRAEKVALHQAFMACHLPLNDRIFSLYQQINRQLWQRMEAGQLDRAQVFYDRFHLLFSQLGWHASPQTVEHTYRVFLSQASFLLPGARAALIYLAERYPLYIASNGLSQTQYTRLNDADIAQYFQGAFISDQIGAKKPELAFFRYCFSHIPGCIPEQMLLIGDSLHTDILGGQRAGVQTCWFNPDKRPFEPSLQPDFLLFSWAEISTIL